MLALLQFLAAALGQVDTQATVQVGALLQGLIALLTSILVALVTWALKRLIAIDKNMSKFEAVDLTKLESSVSRIEVWQAGHSKQDDERHEENLGKFDAIFNSLEKSRKR
jgi:hypothetical protein